MRTVAYQGRPGAFSELAAHRFLGRRVELIPCRRFADVVTAVMQRTATHGVLPIRNSLVGEISQASELTNQAALVIQAELALPIAHALLAAPGVKFADLRRVLSHPVALRQCKGFFRRHPALEKVESEDTAGSIEFIINNHLHDAAAIAGAHAAATYGAQVLAENLEDSAANKTTFALFTR